MVRIGEEYNVVLCKYTNINYVKYNVIPSINYQQ